MTILAIDFGEKNIGTAVGYSDNGVTTPLEVIRRTRDGRELEQLSGLAQKWQVELIVIGSPLNSANEATLGSQQSKKFADQLSRYLAQLGQKLEVSLVDESMSTRISNQGLGPKLKRTMGDAYAAEHILKEYIATLSS